MRLEIACAACGGNRLSLDQKDDASRVVCEECGHPIGTIGELKDQFEEEVLRRAARRDQASRNLN